MPKSGIVLPEVKFDDIEARLRAQHERETLESVALMQVEAGSRQEKILALESLGNRKNLSPHAIMELIRLRDIFKTVDGMEEVVAAINHGCLGHNC